jgi:hypothetical protein
MVLLIFNKNTKALSFSKLKFYQIFTISILAVNISNRPLTNLWGEIDIFLWKTLNFQDEYSTKLLEKSNRC